MIFLFQGENCLIPYPDQHVSGRCAVLKDPLLHLTGGQRLPLGRPEEGQADKAEAVVTFLPDRLQPEDDGVSGEQVVSEIHT